MKPDVALLAEYESLTQGSGLVALPRAVLRAAGADRKKFLHNFCTADIERLEPGSGSEAFFTSVQGKTLGHGIVFCDDQALTFITVPGAGERLIPHLDRYLISEQVTLVDDSEQFATALISGEQTEMRFREQLGITPPSEPCATSSVEIAGQSCLLRRVPYAPHAWLIETPTDGADAVVAAFQAAGWPVCREEAWEMVRLEAAWPEYGRDLDEKNLPQEVGRDATAISFRKGCYLGQETVARIDALGHVNKTLGSLLGTGEEVPPPGTEIAIDGKKVASITSAAWSPRHNGPLALAYLRRGHDATGKRLSDFVVM